MVGPADLDLIQIVVTASGGLGLFLMGMMTMTDGLRALAGDRMRTILVRFTRTPISGVATGTCTTAILQSSSATTVAAVGFVAAELITFPAALGIIFGANLGTTITGWVVALLGFKLKLGLVMLPVVLIGAMIRLTNRGVWRHRGSAIAGFAVIFVGIGFMQEGMGQLADFVSFDTLPGDTITGRLALVAIGIVFTLFTQSSSAGVAAALSAMYAGMISFEQAAALIIGMDVGTTVTAVLASAGGSVAARRTGFAHAVYNCFTAIGGLLLITPYVWAWHALSPGTPMDELALVGFHSLFNGVGVLLILPLTRPFASFMSRLVRDRSDGVSILDRRLLAEPGVALEAVRRALHGILGKLLAEANRLLTAPRVETGEIASLQHALDEVQEFLDELHLSPDEQTSWQRLVANIYLLDHMNRLHERCTEDADRGLNLAGNLRLKDSRDRLLHQIDEMIAAHDDVPSSALVAAAEHLSTEIADATHDLRQQAIDRIGQGDVDLNLGTRELESIRWMERVSHHLARIAHYRNQDVMAATRED